MTDPVFSWALGVLAGAVVGFWIGRWWPSRDPFNRWWRLSPYSTAAIALRALAEESPTVGRIIDPLDERRVQRGNGNGGPATPKPRIIPRGTRSISYPDPGPDRQPTNPFTGKPVKPQPHGGRIIRDGQWDPGWNYLDMSTGFQPRPQDGTPNPPSTDP